MGTASFGNGWEGRVVEGRFPLLEKLGGSENCGSFLTVLQGMQEAVIQLILPGDTEAETYIAQWGFARGLSHPHLTKVFAEGRCVIDRNDLVYVVTERPYSTLSKSIQTRALKADSARETFDPILNALSYLHKNGAVHGYVNPSNIQFADMQPKLSVTDLLIAGSVKRSIPKSGNYDAPELMHGNVTGAADIWSVGMSLCEAMTQALPSWDSSTNKDPEITESLPSPFREIVLDCLRVDPLQRCTIEHILERLGDSKFILMSQEPAAVKMDNGSPALENGLRAPTQIMTSEAPVQAKPEALPLPAEKIGIAESSEPALFSRSLTHFEETPLSRFRVLPYVVVVLAIIALISVLLIREGKIQIPAGMSSQKAPAVSPTMPEKQSAAPTPAPAPASTPAPTPSVPDRTADQASPPVSQTQPEEAQQKETQSAPTPEQPAPPPPSNANRAPARGRMEGLVVKRVIPTVAPGARTGMRRPVEVLIRVSVDQEGDVSDAAYVSPGPGNYFARLSQRSAQSWKFRPPRRNGEAERSVWMLRFNFGREETEVTATEEKR